MASDILEPTKLCDLEPNEPCDCAVKTVKRKKFLPLSASQRQKHKAPRRVHRLSVPFNTQYAADTDEASQDSNSSLVSTASKLSFEEMLETYSDRVTMYKGSQRRTVALIKFDQQVQQLCLDAKQMAKWNKCAVSEQCVVLFLPPLDTNGTWELVKVRRRDRHLRVFARYVSDPDYRVHRKTLTFENKLGIFGFIDHFAGFRA